jgi:recombination protein RecT
MTTALTKSTMAGLLEKWKPQIEQNMARHMDVRRVTKAVLAASYQNPKLFNCSPASLYKSVMDSAQLGVDCSGLLGAGYLVPYGSTCQFIIGYRGLIDLARRSGQILSIEAHVVYAADKFVAQFGTDPKIEHEMDMSADRKDDIVAAYAVAKLRDGSTQTEVMTKADIERVRKISKAGASGPWKDHYAEMARKTVVRRLCKYLPLTAELEAAIMHDNETAGIERDIIDVDPVGPGESATEALADRVMGRRTEATVLDDPPDPATKAKAAELKEQLAEAPPAAAPDEDDIPLAEQLKIQFTEACELADVEGQRAVDAWQRFVKLAVGSYPAEATDEQWHALADRMNAGQYDVLQYAQ